jgi:RNA polymerase sigma-70 factor (ECF subfamily)
MSFSWHEIHVSLLRSSSTLSFQRDFDAIRRGQASLTRFRDPVALLDALHRGSAGPDEKNLLLTRLVEAAQSNRPKADCAVTLLLVALWPGLDAVLRRAKWRRLGAPDDLAAEILARATEAVRCLELGRVSRVAATILRNIERDLVRTHLQEIERARLRAETDPDELAVDPFGSSAERLRRVLLLVTGSDAVLALRVVVQGFSQTEVAVELGISEAAARKRYQRATARLRAAFEEVPRTDVPSNPPRRLFAQTAGPANDRRQP